MSYLIRVFIFAVFISVAVGIEYPPLWFYFIAGVLFRLNELAAK
jgi:hypothetical protein